MRLFVAIAMPDEVSAALRFCRQELPRLHWSRPEQLHLTLGFIADLAAERLPELREELGRVRRPAFDIVFGEIGWFPSARRPRIGWLGLKLTPELAGLKGDVDGCLEAVGVLSDGRAFVPHLTLLRLPAGRHPPEGWPSVLAKHGAWLAGRQFPVADFRLMASELHPAGAVHRLVALFPLGQS